MEWDRGKRRKRKSWNIVGGLHVVLDKYDIISVVELTFLDDIWMAGAAQLLILSWYCNKII